MITNLGLGSNATALTLNSNASDVGETVAIPADAISSNSSISWAGITQPRIYDSGNITIQDRSGDTFRVGNYYSWYASTAGSGTTSMIEADGPAPYSVCPMGWQLPNGGTGAKSFYNLIRTAYGLQNTKTGAENARLRPLSFVKSGYYNPDRKYGLDINIYGNWWSSTAYDTTQALYLYMYAESSSIPLEPRRADPKQTGRSIRCVAL